MTQRRRYRPRPGRLVAAVRLALDTDGLRYRKWGSEQCAKPGDWLVDNDGEVYTVDAASFERAYVRRSLGVYEKTAPVWAERAASAGSVATKEGRSAYGVGDWIVSNDEAGTDTWVIDAASFEQRYQPDD